MLSPDPGGSIPQRKIGSILVSECMVTEQQLEEVLEVQKPDTRYVGRILVTLGYLDDEDLARPEEPSHCPRGSRLRALRELDA